MAKEPERKRKQKEAVLAKIDDGLKEREKKKLRFDDTEFVKEHEKAREEVKETVNKIIGRSSNKFSSSVGLNLFHLILGLQKKKDKPIPKKKPIW